MGYVLKTPPVGISDVPLLKVFRSVFLSVCVAFVLFIDCDSYEYMRLISTNPGYKEESE